MANTNKYTERDFLTAVVNGEVDEQALDYAKNAIKKLDERNEKRKNTQTPAQKENAELCNRIYDTVKTDGKSLTSPEIAEMVGITTAKASALCGMLVKSGRFTVADIKVPKKGTLKSYTAVVAD